MSCICVNNNFIGKSAPVWGRELKYFKWCSNSNRITSAPVWGRELKCVPTVSEGMCNFVGPRVGP